MSVTTPNRGGLHFRFQRRAKSLGFGRFLTVGEPMLESNPILCFDRQGRMPTVNVL
jgi:hypothetical protein